MRPPAIIKPWLKEDEMVEWMRTAPDKPSYQRRLAIWLTHKGKLHAHQVAEFLGVSKQVVWIWIRHYNASGPEALRRKGQGGRQWSLLSITQEREIIEEALQYCLKSHWVFFGSWGVKQLVEKKLGRQVSRNYVYRLLRRHHWRQLLSREYKQRLKDQSFIRWSLSILPKSI